MKIIKKGLMALAVICGMLAAYNNLGEIQAVQSSRNTEIQKYLEGYFPQLLETMKADSKQDYTGRDFASVTGYIVAKGLVNQRNVYQELMGGIVDIHVDEIVLEDVAERKNVLEAMAYVKYSYAWEHDKKREWCSAGTLYRVTLSQTRSGYCVLDLDENGIEARMAKYAVAGDKKLINEAESAVYQLNADQTGDKDFYCAVADVYFDGQTKNVKSLLADIPFPNEPANRSE